MSKPTLIIPAAGKSSRFPGLRPKYLLTAPDGQLMIEKCLESVDANLYDRVVITIVKEHCDKYDADVWLKQVFANRNDVTIIILDDFTSSQSETIYQTINKANITGPFIIKDSDNGVWVKPEQILINNKLPNTIVGYSLKEHPTISNIPGKSFIIANEQNIVIDIIEKEVISDTICLGVYCFESAELFINAYNEIQQNVILKSSELYISHIISWLIANKGTEFICAYAYDYQDWGTITEWKEYQKRFQTYFIDFDGVLSKNKGQYGKDNWDTPDVLLENNLKTIFDLYSNGAQIVITTARPEKYREKIESALLQFGIKPYAIICGLNHSRRVLINDFAKSNPYPSAVAINIPRNSELETFVK